MKEDFLHYIWKNKLFISKEYKADNNELFEIIDTGTPNTDAGPDFFNAKVKNQNTVWAGNIEIHIKASDWKVHKHDTDRAYNNVILHVVDENNSICFNSKNEPVPTIEIEYPKHLLDNYEILQKNNAWVACENKLKLIDPMLFAIWSENLAIERLQSKTEHIQKILISTNNNWEESFYQLVARSYGFGVNSQPFEQMAKSLPQKILLKHKSNLNELEALIFGQSGILELNEIKDEYAIRLNRDYQHLKVKYNLKPIEGHLWKFLRLRPGNFPTIRMAQFAMLVYRSSNLLSKVCENSKVEELINLFESSTSEYWKIHYHFGKMSKTKIKSIGRESIKSIIVNSVAPFLYIYGERTGKHELMERSLEILQNISPEKNSIVQNWKKRGFKARNSFESQALIHLKKEYCIRKKCLQCKIGHNIISNHKLPVT